MTAKAELRFEELSDRELKQTNRGKPVSYKNYIYKNNSLNFSEYIVLLATQSFALIREVKSLTFKTIDKQNDSLLVN